MALNRRPQAEALIHRLQQRVDAVRARTRSLPAPRIFMPIWYDPLTTIGKNASVGPYARLRPGTSLGDGARIGNFVETKAAILEAGVKVNHLSYIGDAEVGANSNIGAGTITCNYDGFSKHKTTIGAGAFVGTNSSLVAPVTIGNGAYIGSGSVITKDVPDDALAVERSPQNNREGGKDTNRAACSFLKMIHAAVKGTTHET